MSEHTKEPWSIQCHTCESPEELGGSDDFTIIGADGTRIAIEPVDWDKGKGADARRIVACVNVLQGVPTEHIEEAARLGITDVSMGNLFSKRLELQKQRDKLLEAAKNLRDVKGRYHTEQAMNRLAEVIAEVEAGE